MTSHEEDRALDVFEEALEEYQRQRHTCNGKEAVKVALRAALVDFEARQVPAERVARVKKERLLLKQNRRMVDAICADAGVRVFAVCSFDRCMGPEVDARGIIVGILTDAGLIPSEIADGLGMSTSTVANLKTMRRERPQWEAKITRFAALLG